MSEPKYSVGEVVILQSVSRPEMNGQYAVTQVVRAGGTYTSQYLGGVHIALDKHNTASYELDGCDNVALWAERALRKKHQGSDDSFEEMVSKLKTGEKV